MVIQYKCVIQFHIQIKEIRSMGGGTISSLAIYCPIYSSGNSVGAKCGTCIRPVYTPDKEQSKFLNGADVNVK